MRQRKWISVIFKAGLAGICGAGFVFVLAWWSATSRLVPIQIASPSPAVWRLSYWHAIGGTGPVPDRFSMSPLEIIATDASADPEQALLAAAARHGMRGDAPQQGMLGWHLAEALQSLRLLRRYTPAEVIDIHLAKATFGHGTHGIHQASKRYFGMTEDRLEIKEILALLVLERGPAFYDPACHPKRFSARYAELARRTQVKAMTATPPLLKRTRCEHTATESDLLTL